MSDDPCNALYDAYVEAILAYQRAAALSRRWVPTQPMSLTEDVTPLTASQAEEMGRDYEREELARKDWILKMDAYFNCRKAHPTAH
jgi:hypothetical protein